MKKWNFKRGKYECTLWISDSANVIVKINDGEPFAAKTIDRGAVLFYLPREMEDNGKIVPVNGLRLDDYEEIKAYYDNLKEDIKTRENQKYEKEFNDLLSGKKPLDISFHEGEYWAGYTAYGVSRDVIKHLHCGHDIGTTGLFAVDKEFWDGNIEKMKAHFAEYREKQHAKGDEEKKYEKGKSEMIDDVEWKTEEYLEYDEGGSTKSYLHTLTVNGETFTFKERNIFDCGRVINPGYELLQGEGASGLASKDDGKWIWKNFTKEAGWRKVRDMTENEQRAFLIVDKFGPYSSTKIRM